MNFISVKGPEIFDKFVGDSEKKIREIFSHANQISPCIIFFDEIDAIGKKRGNSEVSDRILTQLLTEIDGLESRKKEAGFDSSVIVLGATNIPWKLDPALLRPGRFDHLVYIGLPEEKTIFEILEK